MLNVTILSVLHFFARYKHFSYVSLNESFVSLKSLNEVELQIILLGDEVQVNYFAKFDNSFTGSERMFVFIFVRLKITFWKIFWFSSIDFCSANIWIYQNTKTLQAIKQKSNVFTYELIFTGPKINVSNKLGLLLMIYIEEIFSMQSSEFTKSRYFGSN